MPAATAYKHVKKTCFYYWLFEPLPELFEDTTDTKPAFEVPIQFGKIQYRLSIFASGGRLQYARLEIPNLRREVIPERLLSMIQAVREHLLSVLRLGYDKDFRFFVRPIWTFVDSGKPHRTTLEIKVTAGQRTVSMDNLRKLLITSFPFREEMRLLLDGSDRGIPLQYQYLSLYKMLELEFKVRGNWKRQALDDFLKPYRKEFAKLGILRKPSSYLHGMRDKCAHIKIGRAKREVFGVTHLNRREVAQVEKVMPLLRRICIQVINRRGNGKFKLNDHPTTEGSIPIAL